MKPDYDSLAKAGLSQEEIHGKQQSLDAVDYMICKIKEQQ